MSSSNPRVPEPQALLSLRTAVIFVFAVIIGVAVGVLTYWAYATVPLAVLAGVSVAGGATLPLDKVIGR